jgi:uncharacterized protein YdhG (YjbR/CyaY superfamily)
MKMEKFETIDDYITSFPDKTQRILKMLRETIHKTAPEALESMSYGMPTFKYKNKPLVYFSGWKEHIGFYPTPGGINSVPELEKYRTGKGTLQFPLNKPIPYTLIQKVVKSRMEEIEKKTL